MFMDVSDDMRAILLGDRFDTDSFDVRDEMFEGVVSIAGVIRETFSFMDKTMVVRVSGLVVIIKSF